MTRNIVVGLVWEIPLVIINRLTWALVRCEWSHPYGSHVRQSATPRRVVR